MSKAAAIDLVNARNGSIVLLEHIGGSVWKYVCDCGYIGKVPRHRFLGTKRTRTSTCKSCAEKVRKKGYDRKHPLYSTWTGMKQRCYNKKTDAYKNYGGKGVVVCEEWINDYGSFRDWCLNNGWEKGLFLDKDLKGDGLLYSPDTCTIITRKENNRAKKGLKVSMNIAKEIKESGLTAAEVSAKYNLGLSQTYRILKGESWIE